MSTREGGMQIENYYGGPRNMQDFRSYSTNSYYSYEVGVDKEVKIKKSKSRVSSSSSRSWSFNDPELQRKKRVLAYKSYAVEGKMKGPKKGRSTTVYYTQPHLLQEAVFMG
ncbi:putative eukaryotic initiation factor 4A-10-like [Capsicum annuum]|nr:putative eukaryotic initiation factor 4A-10-like [Capsicum annuum]KAF3683113.1 putative eukaryotic initiation factor 4A-10-like [Capsicum annuum]